MPRIPIYEGKQKIQPTAAPRAQQISPHLFEERGRTMQEFGDTLLRMEERTTKLRNLYQTTQAGVNANKQIMEIQDKALQDPDLDTNVGAYNAQIKQVADETGSTISDPIERLQFNSHMAQSITSIGFQLGVEARKTLSTKSKKALEDSLNLSREMFYRAPNDALKQEILVASENLITEYVARGAIDPQKGREMADQLNDEFRVFDIERRREMDAEDAFTILTQGRSGIKNPKLVEEQVKKAEEAVAAQVKKGEALLSDAQDKNEINVVKMLMDDKLTPSFLDTLEEGVDITPDFRDAVEDNLLSGKRFTKTTDSSIHLNFLKQVYSTTGRSPGDVRNLINKIIKANTDGNLAVVNMRRLIGVVDAEFQQAATASRHGTFGRIVNAFSHWVNTMGDGRDETAVRNSLQVIQDVEDGKVDIKNVDKEIQGAIRREVLSQRPDLMLMPQDAEAVGDESGITKLYDQNLSSEILNAKTAAEEKGSYLVRRKTDGVFGEMTPQEYESNKDEFDRF